MKTIPFKFLLFVFVITGMTFFSSCKKKDQKEEKDSDTSSATDQSFASTTVNDMTSIADEAGRNFNISSFKTVETGGLLSASCASVTLDTLLAAKTITVNFGAANCLCNDGRYRRGALVLSFSGKYRDSLTIVTVTPKNYFVNDNQVTGTKSITNKGHNAAHHLVYHISANINIIKPSSGGTISWIGTREREWISGESTLSWLDDTYAITGSASGTTANGNTFSSIITSPLIRIMSLGCRRHFVSGILEHTPGGKAIRIINYGDGSCDDQATVTIDGTIYTITLP